MPQMTDFSRALKARTDEEIACGYTYPQIATRLGVSACAVHDWVAAERAPHSRSWTALARFMRMPRNRLAAMLDPAADRCSP